MTGFTPINAPSLGPLQNTLNHERSNAGAAETPANEHPSMRYQTKSVASEYLGRGDPGPLAGTGIQSSGALHGPGTKKANNRNKKRGSTAVDPISPKRRKTSDVSAGMPIAKSTTRAKKTSASKPKASNESTSADITPFEMTKEDVVNDAMDDSAPTVLSVVALSTSMDTLNTKSQQTSLDALRASSGYGTTLYCGTQFPSKTKSDTFGHNTGIQKHSVQTTSSALGANTRVLRLRKNAAPPPTELLQIPEEDMHGTDTSSKTQTTSKSKSKPTALRKRATSRSSIVSNRQPRRQSAVRKPSIPSDEDFIGDDGDLDEAPVLADSVEEKARALSTTRTASSGKNQLPTPLNSDALTEAPNIDGRKMRRRPTPLLTPDEEFIDIDDEDMAGVVELATDIDETNLQRPSTPPPRERKLNMREVDKREDYGGALFSEEERQLLDSIKAAQSTTETKPIVRKPFPLPILDRSPLFGASNTTVLRTCFRIGEALKEGSQAVRCNKNVVLELYARVTSSSRETKPGRKQHFVFKDLYHDNKPWLEGTYELWDQSRLWELDSRAFLKEREGGVMARVIARMKRVERKWALEVLSIWEAGWGDVEVFAGIYGKDVGFGEED